VRIAFFLLISLLLFASNLEKVNKMYVNHNYKEAYKLYQKSNSVIARNNIAMMYYYGKGVNPDQAKAVGILENLLKKNLTKKEKSVILYNLGMMYYNGFINNFTHKLTVDRKKAKKLIKKSAELGYMPAKNFYDKIYNKKNNNAPKKK